MKAPSVPVSITMKVEADTLWWIRRNLAITFAPNRRQPHLRFPHRTHTLCCRQIDDRQKDRGDSQRMCRVCEAAAIIAHDMTKQFPVPHPILLR